jgi:signal transduction histidine kinase
MQEALNRMEQVIQDLLTFSRKSHHKFVEVSTCDLIRKALKLAQYRVSRRKIDFEIDQSKGPFYIIVDPNRMEQVFLNIVLNAIDSVSDRIEKEPRIEGKISIYFEEDEKYARIYFLDNGVGFDPELKVKIFDPFFTTKRIGEGTGLGLSVSYQIVNDHGGEIKAESEPGKGATFVVVLPKRTPKAYT